MFSNFNRRTSPKESAEKPFWISYADLMTASMTLFLVVMAVEIVSLETKYSTKELQIRAEVIQTCYQELSLQAKNNYPIVNIEYKPVDTINIDLGGIVNFPKRDFHISPEGIDFLREYIPAVVKSIQSSVCSKYIRRVIVEGYTDTDGNYLPNLQLSQRRSSEVVCSLSNDVRPNKPLDVDDLNAIRDLFLIGGFSFNSYKPSKAENRRVVLKLEFWQVNEKEIFMSEVKNKVDLSNKDFGKCPQY
jgi:outer membrane protein OmpA-like peptidoglycan-associated protein